MFRNLIAGCVLWLTGIPMMAQAPDMENGSAQVQAELVADTTAIAPGKPFLAALHLRIQPGWHVYWENPGDSGLPVTLAWKLPEGWKAGKLQWPIPQKHLEDGGLVTYGYEKEVLLLAELTPPANLAPGEKITLPARATWLVCEKTCVPGSANVTLTLPASPTPQASPVAPSIEATQARLPQPGPVPYRISWEPGDAEMRLKVEGLPSQAKADFYPITPSASHPEWTSGGLLRVPYTDEKPAAVRGLLLVDDGGGQKGWIVEQPLAATAPGTSAAPEGTPQLTLARALGFGFLGGFILNLMPCVLPVIALKIFGFLKEAGKSRQRVFRSGLAFVGGIFAWFMGLGVLICVARGAGREVTWAFQFQNPVFVLGMMLLVFVFALNLLGVFEIWVPGTNKLAALSEKEGYGGAFLHGMFATLLATPCTAPFLGSALAFAFTQSTPITLSMFASIAAGMSVPYLLLTANPGWMRWLPKPGMWMVRLKQAFGFLMLATVVWLLGVLGAQKGTAEAIGAAWILLGVGGACWIFGAWCTPAARRPQRYLAVGAMVVLVGAGFNLASSQKAPAEADWEAWSPERVVELQKAGTPYFVDFTADWCINCKYNEKFVLNTDAVKGALKGYVKLRADWTRGDPRITAELKKLGRGGVPVYVVDHSDGSEPKVLPELLTQPVVTEALK
ncbi:MAG: protein-disulfide reductase DsbD family protein [Chthoniobacteraceae bacterium]